LVETGLSALSLCNQNLTWEDDYDVIIITLANSPSPPTTIFFDIHCITYSAVTYGIELFISLSKATKKRKTLTTTPRNQRD